MRMMRFSSVCIYVPGKQLMVTDVLSNKPLYDTGDQELKEDISAHTDHISRSNQWQTLEYNRSMTRRGMTLF